MESQARPMLEATDLSVVYETRSSLERILDSVSVSVNRGEIVGIWGHSGCGKTTLVRALTGLPIVDPGIVSGTVTFEHRAALPDTASYVAGKFEQAIHKHVIAFEKEHHRLLRPLRGAAWRVLFQEPSYAFESYLRMDRQIEEAIRLIAGGDRNQEEKLYLELRDHYGLLGKNLDDTIGRANTEMSGGECQWLSLGLSLMGTPKLLFADEPTTAIAPELRDKAAELIRQKRDATGMGVLLASHNRREMLGLADRVYVLCAGVVIERLSPHHLRESSSDDFHPYTRKLWFGKEETVPVETEADGTQRKQVGIGCPYAPACPYSTRENQELFTLCRTERPPFTPVSGGHEVACWLHHRKQQHTKLGDSGAMQPEEIGVVNSAKSGGSEIRVQVESISKQFFGTDAAKRAKEKQAVLSALNLTLAPSQLVGIIGPNGAGKSTLARIIAGMLWPDTGNVRVDGRQVYGANSVPPDQLRRLIRYVPQNPDAVLLPTETVKQVFDEAAAMADDTKETADWRSHIFRSEIVEQRWMSRSVINLSLGQRRRVVNIRALLSCPQIIIFDEPFNGLDLDSRKKMAGLLNFAALHRRMTVLIISHDVDVVASLCDPVFRLSGGRLDATTEVSTNS